MTCDEEFERGIAEHGGINAEAVDVGRGQPRAVLAHDVAVAPGVVDAAHEVGEAAATVREAQFQRARQALEGARQDQPQNRQLRLRRHGYQPRKHVTPHALGRHHVPGMHEHRGALGGAVLQEGDDAGVMQLAAADVVADVHAGVAVAHGAAQLAAGEISILQRHLTQRFQAPRVGGADGTAGVVEEPGALQRLQRRTLVREQQRCGAHDLHLDAVAIHVLEPHRRVPAGRGHRTELAVPDHEHGAVRPGVLHPWPVAATEACRQVRPGARQEVRMDVDDFHGSLLTHQRRGDPSAPAVGRKATALISISSSGCGSAVTATVVRAGPSWLKNSAYTSL